eukprot:gene42086-61033_t
MYATGVCWDGDRWDSARYDAALTFFRVVERGMPRVDRPPQELLGNTADARRARRESVVYEFVEDAVAAMRRERSPMFSQRDLRVDNLVRDFLRDYKPHADMAEAKEVQRAKDEVMVRVVQAAVEELKLQEERRGVQ